MNVMVFDIETVPDVAAARRLHAFDGLDDEAVVKAMQALRFQKTGSDFLAHPLHQIVAISVVLSTPGDVKVWSLGDVDADEKEILRRFFEGVERFLPTLVSWNGSGFDLPVMHYRSLLHSISAPVYWETGDQNQSFRYNNYLGRFHWRHLDLMDVIAGYQMRANAPLDMIASMLGFPGKLGMDGSQVWPARNRGEKEQIRHYCETDVLNTYLVYLRFELMRGHLSQSEYAQRCESLRELLLDSGAEHLLQFERAWPAS